MAKTPKGRRRNSLLWLFEPLEEDPRYLQRKFFNMDAAYLDGRLYLATADQEDPWNGLMVCTSREHHAGMTSQFPQLMERRVLGKWLYLSQTYASFETVSVELVELARRRDARLGVEAQPRARNARS